MKQFIKEYIDAHPGLMAHIYDAGISRDKIVDYRNQRQKPTPSDLWLICFVIAQQTNEPIYDILLSALLYIERDC